MAKRRNFIERDVFEEVMRHVRRTDGGKYEDVDTIYGDMSRLVVGWRLSWWGLFVRCWRLNGDGCLRW